MRNNRNLKESDLDRLVRLISEEENMEEKELDEILSSTKLGDLYQGVRGFVKGESFGFFKYLSKIKNRSGKVLGEIKDIEKFMTELKDLKPRVEKLSIAPEKKWRLINLLDFVIEKWEPFFPSYSRAIEEINKITSEKLSGERLDVIPGSKENQLGIDYKQDADTKKGEPQKTEFVPLSTTTTTTKKPSGFSSGSIPKKPELTKADDPILEEVSRFKQLIK